MLAAQERCAGETVWQRRGLQYRAYMPFASPYDMIRARCDDYARRPEAEPGQRHLTSGSVMAIHSRRVRASKRTIGARGCDHESDP
jgi:hypothetical protein